MDKTQKEYILDIAKRNSLNTSGLARDIYHEPSDNSNKKSNNKKTSNK